MYFPAVTPEIGPVNMKSKIKAETLSLAIVPPIASFTTR